MESRGKEEQKIEEKVREWRGEGKEQEVRESFWNSDMSLPGPVWFGLEVNRRWDCYLLLKQAGKGVTEESVDKMKIAME